MSYCTSTDLITRFSAEELVQLTDRSGANAVDDDVLNAAIADADADINAALVRYTLPLAYVPENIVRIACDLTRYYLYDDAVIDVVQKRYDTATNYLIMLTTGKIMLPADVNGAVQEATGNTVLMSSETAVFNAIDY